MKRTLSLALCLILSLALLAGCGAAPLPDGLTQESVTDAAAQTVAQLNDEDYSIRMLARPLLRSAPGRSIASAPSPAVSRRTSTSRSS